MPGPNLEQRLQESQNVTHITDPDMPRTAKTRSGREIVLSRDAPVVLNGKRELFTLLHDLDLSSLDGHVGTWSELRSTGIEVIERHVKNSQQSMDAKQIGRLLCAGTAGAGTIGAFLQVIPEVAGPAADQDQTRKIARRSLGTMMAWARFSKGADEDLTHILSGIPIKRPTPLRDEQPYEPTRDTYVGLSFNPAYFMYDAAAGTIVLNREKLNEHVTRIDVHARGTDIYYGCPFRQGIPRFYQAMLQTAIRSGLL